MRLWNGRGILVSLLLSCGAPSSKPAPEAPVARPLVTAPGLTSASPMSSGPNEAELPARKSRSEEVHDATDRLLDGELTRAEQRCAAEPRNEREACVDAALAERQGKTSRESRAARRQHDGSKEG
jgi:hypothetical protein